MPRSKHQAHHHHQATDNLEKFEAANDAFATDFKHGDLPMPPARKVCEDQLDLVDLLKGWRNNGASRHPKLNEIVLRHISDSHPLLTHSCHHRSPS